MCVKKWGVAEALRTEWGSEQDGGSGKNKDAAQAGVSGGEGLQSLSCLLSRPWPTWPSFQPAPPHLFIFAASQPGFW